MIPLKFRVWDTVSKKYLWPWPDGFSLFGEVTCFDCVGQQMAEMGRGGLLWLDDIVTEQFTGLKDKNGKDIYENDLVIANDIWAWRASKVITFQCGCFGVKNGDGDFLDMHYFYDSTGCELEVVGNVHENLELLS